MSDSRRAFESAGCCSCSACLRLRCRAKNVSNCYSVSIPHEVGEPARPAVLPLLPWHFQWARSRYRRRDPWVGPLRLQCPTTGCIGMAEAWLPARDGKLINATARSPRDLFVTHGGRAYTLQRIKRSKPEAAVITQGGAKTRARSALLRAMAATLHLLLASLQQGRLFGELRGRAG